MLKFLLAGVRQKAFDQGYTRALLDYHSEQEKTKMSSLQMNITREFIVITNEWENPVVGKLIRYMPMSVDGVMYGEDMYPEFLDYITGQTVACGKVMFPYTEDMLRVLVDNMTPYERWGVVAKTTIRPLKKEPTYPFQYKPLLSAAEIIEKVKAFKEQKS